MSLAPFAPEPALQRLVEEGYQLSLVNNWLVVDHIPYVTAGGAVGCGEVGLSGEHRRGTQIIPACAHELWLIGEQPRAATGQPLSLATESIREVAPGLTASYMLSSKPMPEGTYPDQYTKITTYVRILSHEALALDPTVTARPGASWNDQTATGVFVYPDTATSRAALGRLGDLFRGHNIGIVGLGGTGSYVLDQVAKTPVEQIRLIDGDFFENHNAFRAPGAASLDQLRTHPLKVD